MTLIDLFAKRNSFGALPDATRLIPKILTESDRGDTTPRAALSAGATNARPTTVLRVNPHAAKLTRDQRTRAALMFEMAAVEAHEDLAQGGCPVARRNAAGPRDRREWSVWPVWRPDTGVDRRDPREG